MGIKVIFEFDTTERAAGFLLNQCANPPGAVVQKAPQEGLLTKEAPAPAKKPRATKKAEEKASAPAAPLPEATQEDAQRAVERLFEARGMPTCKEVMSHYGVNRVRDMKPEHYAKFVAHADKVIAGEEV